MLVVGTFPPKLCCLAAVIFVAYLLLFCWLVAHLPFFVKSGLGRPVLVGMFLCKIGAGLAYAKFYSLPQYIAGSDTFRYFDMSKTETDWLLTNPWAFIKDIFQYGYASSGNLFSGQNSYWNDLKSSSIIKLLAICNVLTLKNYYANLVLFNFLFFFGPVAFYRVMNSVFTGKKWLKVISIFLLPSFLFWCSGVHKDGLLFACMAMLIFSTHKQMLAGKILPFALAVSVGCLLGIFALRNVVCLLLMPALAVWWLCNVFTTKQWVVVAGVYTFCILLFFASPYVTTNLNLPQYTINKQNEFKVLKGGSQVQVRSLQPTMLSFVQFLPTAADMALLRPHIAEIKNISYIPAIGEMFVLWFLAGLFLVNYPKAQSPKPQPAVVIFCFCFALSYLLLMGYTVTFSGAIVRYRSIMLPLLFCPLVCIANIGKKLQ